MNKKLIWIVIFLFFIINIFSLNAFYNNFLWKDLYEKKWFSNSVEYFEKAWNIEWFYNKANALYKQKKYIEAIKEYKSILWDEKNDLNFRINHNIANTFYRIWEEEKDSTKKIKNWEESIKYYTDALNIKYDEETKKNLEFVLEKIKKQKEEEKNKDNKEDNKKDWDKQQDWKEQNWDKKNNWDKKEWWEKKWDKSDKQQEKWWESWKDWEEKKDWEKSDQENAWESWEDWKQWEQNQQWEGSQNNKDEEWLSQEQQQAIKQYEEQLKKEQEQNADSFNKVYEENNSNDPFDSFFNDPFFNNNLLNWGSEEKDW